jgi:hypothetical protein
MEPATRGKLEELALERLDATADDEEQWSFLFRTDGAVDVPYCPWFVTEEWEFERDTEDLDLPWSAERRELIESGGDNPTEDELREWRRAMCRKLAPGSDWSWAAWIVPLWIEDKVAGYAAFLVDASGDPDEAPILEGIFDSIDEAKAALAIKGAVVEREG